MTESPHAVVERLLALFAEGLDEIGPELRGLLDPEVEWVNPPDAIEGGVRTGYDGWMTAIENMRTGLGPNASYDVDSAVERGDRVLVRGLMHTGGTASGAEAGMRTYSLWTVADGRVTRFEWFFDGDAAQARFEELAGPG